MHVQRQLLFSGTDLLASAKRRRLLHRSITETHESRVRKPASLAEIFDIRHFEVARETGSRWLSSALWDCFGGRIFNMAANLSPKQSHNALWQLSRPGAQRNLKVANSHPLLAAAEAYAQETEWGLNWNVSIPVVCSKFLTSLATVQVETGLWGWAINQDNFCFSFHWKRDCHQFQAVYVKKMFGITPYADSAHPITMGTPAFPWDIAFYYVRTGSGLPATLEASPSPLVPWPSTWTSRWGSG